MRFRSRRPASIPSARLLPAALEDTGAATVAAVGVVAATIVLTAAVLAASAGLVTHQRLAAAADSAALAASDTASGLLGGEPCLRAGEVSAAMGARLESCTTDRAEARVTVSARAIGVELRVSSRAGPPRAGGEP